MLPQQQVHQQSSPHWPTPSLIAPCAALFTGRRRARALCHRQVPARLRMRTVSLPRGHQSASIQPALRANNSR